MMGFPEFIHPHRLERWIHERPDDDGVQAALSAQDQPEFLAPPAGWYPLADPVMSNDRPQIYEAVAVQLRLGGCWAAHSGWEFNGCVWFDGGRWHERVTVHHQVRASFSADTIEELMKTVNDEFGWA